jgi:hypothetical protein
MDGADTDGSDNDRQTNAIRLHYHIVPYSTSYAHCISHPTLHMNNTDEKRTDTSLNCTCALSWRVTPKINPVWAALATAVCM